MSELNEAERVDLINLLAMNSLDMGRRGLLTAALGDQADNLLPKLLIDGVSAEDFAMSVVGKLPRQSLAAVVRHLQRQIPTPGDALNLPNKDYCFLERLQHQLAAGQDFRRVYLCHANTAGEIDRAAVLRDTLQERLGSLLDLATSPLSVVTRKGLNFPTGKIPTTDPTLYLPPTAAISVILLPEDGTVDAGDGAFLMEYRRARQFIEWAYLRHGFNSIDYPLPVLGTKAQAQMYLIGARVFDPANAQGTEVALVEWLAKYLVTRWGFKARGAMPDDALPVRLLLAYPEDDDSLLAAMFIPVLNNVMNREAPRDSRHPFPIGNKRFNAAALRKWQTADGCVLIYIGEKDVWMEDILEGLIKAYDKLVPGTQPVDTLILPIIPPPSSHDSREIPNKTRRSVDQVIFTHPRLVKDLHFITYQDLESDGENLANRILEFSNQIRMRKGD